MGYEDWLLVKAGIYWSVGDPLPTDLFMEMTNAGMNVDYEENMHHLTNQPD